MDEITETNRAYVKALFQGDEPEDEQAPAVRQEPVSAPVIPGQERTPDQVTESPLRAFTRELFEQ
ncbi:hypothetical protein [Arthrobacter sp. H5]|uniref:hypothetical protein n=1 Tax=Arthrobacter sp. H5 TaxID=1267973 RepID=UPI000487976A|nr:hypothetical protein [Arthrobacter sp. H5]